EATKDALRQLGNHKPSVALLFDCVATRLRTEHAFDNELAAVTDSLNSTALVGCNTYGQIARVDGQFNGFHNCTAVVCVIPA
ncbi:MAG TPA: FIST C-terminal domain-containing protein, partial [Candidatus Saccharimonadales bacterium]|nr:FIST C-terminal domain-containing protein [Candidatus Saccharimonadales bacterium]